MKKRLAILLFFSFYLLPSFAQEFIGCRTDSGWAETAELRKTFMLNESDFKHHDFQTLKFTVEVASLGYHEVYMNGVKLGDKVLQPAVSQLDKRALLVEYDITDYVHKGNNELMLWIGQGWGRIYGTPAAVKAAVMREVSDEECGVSDYVVWTDSTWESTPTGYSYTGSWQPLQFGGERYDARVKPDWRPASVYHADGISISRQEFKGNHVVDTVAPVEWTSYFKNTMLFDFGRMVTGWSQIDFPPMPEGTEMFIHYLDNLQSTIDKETDIYIARGKGKEHFTSRFHTHSFRYVSIETVNPDLHITKIKARALQISAVDPKEGATFECSDPRLNAIHDMVKYTLSNLTFSGYMVDCPHLKRMGYGGDGNASTMTLQTLWDVRDTYRNWMTAWGDAMESDGELPYVAPAFRTGGGPYWQGFIVKAPWRTWVNYGARYLMVKYYSKMKRWLEYIERNSVDYILQPWPDNERHTWFLGDWLAPEGVDVKGESVLHVNSCFISECLGDMEQIARLTGHHDDARHYAAWRDSLGTAIHRHFYHPETHTYANGTPLDQCYALLMGIPPDSATAAAVKEQLLKNCHGKYRDHIAVGLVGVPVFTEWCIRERQTDLMATILRQPDYPGYLYMIDNGATATWESWNGDRSRVHNCYNGIGIWFYQALAGIRPDEKQPGYKHFFVDPQPCEGVDWIKCTKPTPYGDIRVEINGKQIKVRVPEGTTATLFPGTDREQILVGGEHITTL